MTTPEPKRERYTAADMLSEAAAGGYTASHRLILDWVSLGLLDSPTQRGRGRGKGTEATWPRAQLQLFLALLQHRGEVKRIASLCNLPVWGWLTWGDGWVPLRQVRRALGTWGGEASEASWGKARAKAREIVEKLAHPVAKQRDRRNLVTGVAEMLYKGEPDPARLGELLRPILDPLQTGLPRGPVGAQFSTDRAVRMVILRYRALAEVETLDESLFEWARFVYLTQHEDYERNRPMFAADPDLGQLFTPYDLETAVNAACLDLITILGLGLDIPNEAADGTLQHPATWRDAELEVKLRGLETDSGLRVELEVAPKGGSELEK